MQIDWLFALTGAIIFGAGAFLISGIKNGLFARARVQLTVVLEALRGLKWREFAGFVIALLEKRGLAVDEQARKPGENGADILMKRGSARYIVQCKHGSAYCLKEAGLEDLVRLIQQEAVSGAILVNAGGVNPAIHERAASRGVEVLEGAELWQQLEPNLPFNLVEDIHKETDLRLRRNRNSAAVMAILFAMLGGGAAYMLGTMLGDGAASHSPAAPAGVGAAQPTRSAAGKPPADRMPVSTDTASPGHDAAEDRGPSALPDPDLTFDQAQLRREQAETAVQTLSGVQNASWNTRSTMVVVLPSPSSTAATSADGDPSTTGAPEAEDLLAPVVRNICNELTRYEELRYTRLQISYANPRDEDEARVRWRQCR
ncbi:MAG: restriction endonuclease [Xanthomonadales bacterium]|nr:restriction endonuclease [Xanthomonadales bacterium]